MIKHTTFPIVLHIPAVPPTLPSNVRVSNAASSQVQVTWSLTHQHADERAESLTLMVRFSNGTISQQYQLEGNATQQMVDTVPGMEYLVTVSVFNQDGTRTTDPVPFQTPPGRKYLDVGELRLGVYYTILPKFTNTCLPLLKVMCFALEVSYYMQ